ncbi:MULTISPECIES: DUF2254 domain-containing protein [Paenarthrobacter]|uniref:DUF2254 domain-containing protein n=1 Tax=Paenarthrobacter TaxID=1742992 RepID=UPI00222FB6E9|nr:DUF2254 domain-containing protein [Paenarthrobacter sp. PAE-2]MCW3768196.1 DUF2254 domain-containing protein [Paenarthrobacter sp. PAE-2]
MNSRTDRWADAIRTRLWPVPTLAVALAVALGTALPALDATVDGQLPGSVSVLLFSGGPEAARAVLQAIAGSLITVTSLTFSLTVVTLQLASSQFSPRLLRTFSADRFVHGTLALFLAAFAFALTVLRSVRGEGSGHAPFVPEISITIAFALAIASVIGLVLFLAHLTREIRVETMMRTVNKETQGTMDRVFPADRPAQGPAPRPLAESFRIQAESSGFLTSWDEAALLEAANKHGAVLRLDREPGSSLIQGVPFATAWPLKTGTPVTAKDRAAFSIAVNAAVATGFERTSVQDLGFGFRQLVDVAVRALSPGINDPTTAVHIIGHLSSLLCRLAEREGGPEQLTDDEGRVRVVLPLPSLPELLGLAMTQIRHYGATDPEVARRLLQLLHELAFCDRKRSLRMVILEHLDHLRDAITASSHLERERQELLDDIDTCAASVEVGEKT